MSRWRCCCSASAVTSLVAMLALFVGGLLPILLSSSPFTDDGRVDRLVRQGLYPPPPPPRWVQKVGVQVLRLLEYVKALLVPPDVRILEKVAGLWQAKCIFAAAQLGIADAIPLPSEGEWPTAAEIGKRVGVQNEELIYRFLRALASLGILKEHSGKRFSHTEYSVLMSEHQGVRTSRSLILTWGGGQSYAWDGLAQQLRTGENAFHVANGMDLWEYYRAHQDEEQHFQRMLADLSRMVTPPLVADFNWPAAVLGMNATPTIVDVGGGLGSVLAEVLAELPDARGILFDQAAVIQQARETSTWRERELAERVEFVAGSFFEEVPAGDIIIMRSILHDWNDETSIAILKNARQALSPQGKLFVVEHLLPPAGQTSNQVGVPAEMVDLHMMVLLDGKERTEAEFRHLLAASGFCLVATHHTRSVYHYVEATPC